MQRMHLTAWAGACLFVLAAGCGGTSEAQPASDASVESTATPLAAAPTTAERAAKARKIAKARARYLKELAARKAAETKAKAEAARQLALTRQKELASYGYRIAIDGDWGPRSKGAWAEYQLRKGESYASSWGADAIVVISGLTNGSETLDRILNSLAFTDTYSETEFTSAVSALRNCQVSLFGSQPPLREGYEAVLQLAAQGCDAYQSALDQLPQAMGSDDYFPFSGVQAALMQGDARFASVGYELDRAVGVLGLSGGSAAPAPTPDYNAPAPESSYGGDLDCVDFDGQSMSPAGIHMVSMAMAMAMESAVNDRRRAARWLERALPYRGIGFALTRADEVLRRRSTVIEVCCIDLCTTVTGWRGS